MAALAAVCLKKAMVSSLGQSGQNAPFLRPQPTRRAGYFQESADTRPDADRDFGKVSPRPQCAKTSPNNGRTWPHMAAVNPPALIPRRIRLAAPRQRSAGKRGKVCGHRPLGRAQRWWHTLRQATGNLAFPAIPVLTSAWKLDKCLLSWGYLPNAPHAVRRMRG
jgi:hypothetical protein